MARGRVAVGDARHKFVGASSRPIPTRPGTPRHRRTRSLETPALNLDLNDRVVFVAGASRGIGLAIAEACLAEGARLALTARGEAALRETEAGLAAKFGRDRIWAIAGDLRDTEVIEAALAGAEASLGPIWGAVANVGLHHGPGG